MAAESQRERGRDGLADVRCPYCNWRWYRMAPGNCSLAHEMKCARCRRVIVYRVEEGIAIDFAAIRV